MDRLALVLVVVVALSTTPAQSATLVSDAFTGTNGTSLIGRTPDVGPSGTTWISGNSRGTTLEGNRVRIDSTESLDISIGGSYTPGVLEVSGFLDRNNINTGIWNQIRGVGLGFRDADSFPGEGWAHFRGIVLRPDGALSLVDTEGGALPPNPDIVLATGVAGSGTLSFKVDTVTGDIFDIVYDGNPIGDVATTNFTSDNVQTLSAYSVGITGNVWGYVDDLLLMGIPLSLLVPAAMLTPPPPPAFLPRLAVQPGGEGTAYPQNVRAIAAALDEARDGASGELADLIADLDDLDDDGELTRALGQLSPARAEAAGRAILVMTRRFHRSVHRNVFDTIPVRIAQRRPGAPSPRHDTFSQALDALPSVSAPVTEEPPSVDMPRDARWHAFLEPLAGYGTLDENDGRVGQRWWSAGLLGGVDVALRDDLVLGLSAAYGYTDASERGGDTSGNVNTGRVGPYVAFARGPVTVDAGLSFGYHAIDDDRRVLGSTAGSDHDAWDVAFHGSTRWAMERGGFRFGPVASLEYVHLEEDGYRESGGSGAALRVSSRDTDSLGSTLGGHVTWRAPLREVDLAFDAQAGWFHEFLDDAESLGARFSQSPSSGFRIRLPESDRDAVRASVGADLGLSESWRVKVGWEGVRSSTVENHTGSVRFEMRF